MAANNQRQVLTETDLLSIVESTEAELLEADRKLIETTGKVLDGIFNAGVFEHLVKAKVYQASTVMVKEQPAFVIIHTRNALGWLIVEGAVRIGKAPIKHLFEGGYAIARHVKAPQIVFVTKLKGLYNYAMDHEFKSLGVILCKKTPDEALSL